MLFGENAIRRPQAAVRKTMPHGPVMYITIYSRRGARYALRVSRSVVVSLSLSRRNAASESEPVMYGVYITFQAGRPLGRPLRIAKKHWNFPVLFSLISGFLSSQGAFPQVLSAFAGLTAVFGMGTGGSPQLSPLNYVIQASDKSDVSDSHSFARRLRLLQNWFSAYRILTTA